MAFSRIASLTFARVSADRYPHFHRRIGKDQQWNPWFEWRVQTGVYDLEETAAEMGMKDVGFGMTVQDKNAYGLVVARYMSFPIKWGWSCRLPCTTRSISWGQNIIHDRPMVAKNFENLVNELLKSNSPRSGSVLISAMALSITSTGRSACCSRHEFRHVLHRPVWYGCLATGRHKEVMGNLNRQTWMNCGTAPEAWGRTPQSALLRP